MIPFAPEPAHSSSSQVSPVTVLMPEMPLQFVSKCLWWQVNFWYFLPINIPKPIYVDAQAERKGFRSSINIYNTKTCLRQLAVGPDELLTGHRGSLYRATRILGMFKNWKQFLNTARTKTDSKAQVYTQERGNSIDNFQKRLEMECSVHLNACWIGPREKLPLKVSAGLKPSSSISSPGVKSWNV